MGRQRRTNLDSLQNSVSKYLDRFDRYIFFCSEKNTQISDQENARKQTYTSSIGKEMQQPQDGMKPRESIFLFHQCRSLSCGFVVSCFIFKFCPHMPCFALHSLPLCDFPPYFCVHLCPISQSVCHIVCVLPAALVVSLFLCLCVPSPMVCFWLLFLVLFLVCTLLLLV